MNAKQLIKATKECVATNWQNSNLPRNVEVLFEMMADHFEKCEDCRNQFDAEEYTSETLIEFSSELHLSNTNPSDWICVSKETFTEADVLVNQENSNLMDEGWFAGGYFWSNLTHEICECVDREEHEKHLQDEL